jgi:hypothetical protein
VDREISTRGLGAMLAAGQSIGQRQRACVSGRSFSRSPWVHAEVASKARATRGRRSCAAAVVIRSAGMREQPLHLCTQSAGGGHRPCPRRDWQRGGIGVLLRKIGECPDSKRCTGYVTTWLRWFRASLVGGRGSARRSAIKPTAPVMVNSASPANSASLWSFGKEARDCRIDAVQRWSIFLDALGERRARLHSRRARLTQGR